MLKNQIEKTSAGFQSRTQTTSVNPKPNINNTETTESISATETTGISISTSFSLIPGIIIPLQVPTKTMRSSSDNNFEPSTSEKFTSQDKSFAVTSHQFEVENTAALQFFQFSIFFQ